MSLSSKSILHRYSKERRFDESDQSLLSRLLTVRFNDSNLTKIGDLSELNSLVKLYVRNNQINSIANISTAPQLTHLYIINNKVTELPVNKLTKLEKLYAGGNNIQIIEGLTNLDELLELHIESQKLHKGEKMHIEPESLNALQWLQVLNVSNNGIDNLDFIENLKELRTFKCEDNKIERFSDLKKLKNCVRLSEVVFAGNPISKMSKYRDNVILNVNQIKLLDQREIKENEKNFIRDWNEHKIQSLTRENTKIKPKPIQHFDQADISHLATGLPSGIDNLVRLIRKRESGENVASSPSAPAFSTKEKLSQSNLHQTLSIRDAAFDPGNLRQMKLDAPHDIGGGDEDRVIDESLGNTDAVVEAVKNGKLLAIESGGNQLAES